MGGGELIGDKNASRPKHRWVSPVTELGWSSPRIRDEAKSPPRSLMGCWWAVTSQLDHNTTGGSSHVVRVSAPRALRPRRELVGSWPGWLGFKSCQPP